jgi:hypothetical protein
MQPTIDITPDTIGELHAQWLGKRCYVQAFGGSGADQAYVLDIQGTSYRITRNNVRLLLSQKRLPANLAVPIIDYAIENGIFQAQQPDNDGDMMYWI